MNAVVKSYRNGVDVVGDEIISDIIEIILETEFSISNYTALKLNEILSLKLKKKGWSDKVRLASTSKITITSMQNDVGLCMQTGNISRIYADLIKLQTLYIENTIKCGIIILPTLNAARKLGGNLANLDRVERELEIFSSVITIPLTLIGFDD